MAAFTMLITNGTDTINFDGSDGYSLIDSSWAPQRAQRSESEMGHVYEDVIETVAIVITGGSPAHVMERYAALSDLLDQAESWGKDDAGIDAVLFKYQPNGSTLTDPLQSPIWREPGSPRMLVAPTTTNEAGYRGNVLTPVIVTFTRLGQLLGATEEKSSAEGTDNPVELATATFTDTSSILAPHDIKIAINRVTGSDNIYKLFVLLQNAAAKIHIEEGENATYSATGGSWADTVVTGSSGGSVARYTFSGTGNSGYLRDEVVVMGSGSQNVAWYAMIDNDCDQDIKVSMGAAIHVSFTSAQSFVIPAGSPYNTPTIYYLGITSLPADITESKLSIEVVDSSATATGTLDIDYYCGIVLDENASIIEFNDAYAGSTDTDIVIEHRLDEKKSPVVWSGPSGGGVIEYISYRGNASIHMTGNIVTCLIFGQTSAGDYSIDDGSTGKADITLTAIKTAGYLTPL